MKKIEDRIIYADAFRSLKETAIENELREVSEYRKNKVERLIGDDKKKQSLACGLLLKECLRRLDIDEKTAKYFVGENGKPSFKDYPQVKFSLSHSGRYAVCVLSGSEIGCDVQEIKEPDFKTMEKFFSDGEKKFLGRLSETEKKDAFFSVWARKESFIKARGDNLISSFKRFSVCDENGFCDTVRYDGKEYFIKEYDALYGYKLAVCSLFKPFDGELSEYSFCID